MGAPLFIYDEMPKPMKRYLSHFGWRFNKALCEEAVSRMYKTDSNGKKTKVPVKTKEQVDDILKRNGVELKNKHGYDYVYAYHMAYADFFAVSVDDERHLAMTVKAIIDDPDNPGGNVFGHWYIDQLISGEGVDFEDYLE